MKRRLILLLTAVLVCLCFTAAADGDTLAFETGMNQIREGETLQTVLTREGEPAGGELSYKSSDERIATVDENGLVTAVKKGNVTIAAYVKTEKKTYKAQMKLTVVRPVASLTVREDRLPVCPAEDGVITRYLAAREGEENSLPVLLLSVKKTLQIAAAVEPRDASNRKVVLSSDNPDVFTVRNNNITGVAPGEGILTVASESDPEVNVRYRVLVVLPVKKLAVEGSEPFVTVGGQMKVTSSATPEDATIHEVEWSSRDERILTVDADGTVTGVKRGNGRVIATAKDGSNVRANFNIKVVQNPESVELASDEVTLDVGKTTSVKATVMPKDTDNKKLTWVSSDENIATVGRDGRIRAVSRGDCTVTCICQGLESVTATLTVHVQQPVKKVAFTEKNVTVYAGESAQLSWTTEPQDATNPTLAFSSSRDSIVTVDQNGIINGVSSGKANVIAVTTDGSRRKAQIAVRVGSHLTGISMRRRHAYLSIGESDIGRVDFEPRDALNKNMSWVSSDENVVTYTVDKNGTMHLNGEGYGNAVVTGTAEDGGLQTSIAVTVGDYDRALSFHSFDFDDNGNFWLKVRNDSDVTITRITAQLAVFDGTGEDKNPVAVNTDDGSNTVDIVWSGTLEPGEMTGTKRWKMVNYKPPASGIGKTHGTVTVCKYQIDNDWIKTIRKRYRKVKEY